MTCLKTTSFSWGLQSPQKPWLSISCSSGCRHINHSCKLVTPWEPENLQRGNQEIQLQVMKARELPRINSSWTWEIEIRPCSKSCFHYPAKRSGSIAKAGGSHPTKSRPGLIHNWECSGLVCCEQTPADPGPRNRCHLIGLCLGSCCWQSLS